MNSEAEKNKPKKPVNGYFKFRMEKLLKYKDEADKMRRIK